MFPEGQLPIQVVRPCGGPGAQGRPTAAAAAVVAVGPKRVGSDGDVGVHGAGAGFVQDEVHVIVVETAFVLIGGYKGSDDEDWVENVRLEGEQCQAHDMRAVMTPVATPSRKEPLNTATKMPKDFNMAIASKLWLLSPLGW
ncbi:hypothetical protein CRUP_004179 [Coryphaenoides rupestris]|nr:hypothetical protein CRUP_004179 [Coryphaenoides rupestris]